jgi:superfamily II RNA helicase
MTVHTLSEILRLGRQYDPAGVEVVMSRQACEEAADRIEKLEAYLNEATEHLLAITECDACDSCLELANHALGCFPAQRQGDAK